MHSSADSASAWISRALTYSFSQINFTQYWRLTFYPCGARNWISFGMRFITKSNGLATKIHSLTTRSAFSFRCVMYTSACANNRDLIRQKHFEKQLLKSRPDQTEKIGSTLKPKVMHLRRWEGVKDTNAWETMLSIVFIWREQWQFVPSTRQMVNYDLCIYLT